MQSTRLRNIPTYDDDFADINGKDVSKDDLIFASDWLIKLTIKNEITFPLILIMKKITITTTFNQ